MSNMTAPFDRPYYTEDINFALLAEGDAALKAVLDANKGRIDWQDPEALKQVKLCLTNAILARDFSLKLTLPDDRLCPPIPVRWNYIRWIQDLLTSTQSSTTITGLDIGTGASAIYALLAARLGWRMRGSDIDSKSVSFAQRNAQNNRLRILICTTTPADPLIPLDRFPEDELDFVVCNPPFYSSDEDMQSAYADNPIPASAICTGSTNEMIGPGGDVGFATRLIEESLVLRERVRWYTCMLSRLISLHQVIAKLKEAGIVNWAVTNLQAGQKTRRWAVAWSFRDFRPANEVARHGELVLGVLPPATEWTITVAGVKAADVGRKVNELMCALDLRWVWKEGITTGMAATESNVWSRAARRKKKAIEAVGMSVDHDSDGSDEDIALMVKVVCSDGRADVRWMRGLDHVIWESFCGMLKRSLGAR
ncbi:hypothetical protein B0A48_07653 [Cryoendolithus antarcticus]|uniref:Uncharacterized protein n=1 Tax=Cryoendolithus antarcticus TaxID=1507870 RepID=A0A1V8T6Q3_9PEZI|nr:hypothetical protein B0A48_07653 [Cryoendolithus antarcticus]